MWIPSWLRFTRPASSRASSRRPRRHRPCLEQLEGRSLPAAYTAASVPDLIADINAANLAGGDNTITLAPGTTFTLTAPDNWTEGETGLPAIAVNDTLTIVGNGDTIAGNGYLRLLAVNGGATLTLQGLTLQGGSAAKGGAIYNQGSLGLDGVTVQQNAATHGGGIWSSGSLTLKGSTVQNNVAWASWAPAEGGGIWSSGSLTLEGGTVQSNVAQGYPGEGGGIWSSGSLTLGGGTTVQNNLAAGSSGQDAYEFTRGNRTYLIPPGIGEDGLGGGLYVAGGTVNLTDVTLSSNTAQGGQGGSGVAFSLSGRDGGDGLGGGLFAESGTVTLVHVTVANNAARGGAGGRGTNRNGQAHDGHPGVGKGGGLFRDAHATVSLDAFTQANVKDNAASTNNSNIYGSYTQS